MRKLAAGEKSPWIYDCVTCMACDEYCPTNARPFDLIMKRHGGGGRFHRPEAARRHGRAVQARRGAEAHAARRARHVDLRHAGQHALGPPGRALRDDPPSEGQALLLQRAVLPHGRRVDPARAHSGHGGQPGQVRGEGDRLRSRRLLCRPQGGCPRAGHQDPLPAGSSSSSISGTS